MSYRFEETKTEKAICRKLHNLAVEWAEENGTKKLAKKLGLLPVGGLIFLQRTRPMGEAYRACEMLGIPSELICGAIGSALVPQKEL